MAKITGPEAIMEMHRAGIRPSMEQIAEAIGDNRDACNKRYISAKKKFKERFPIIYKQVLRERECLKQYNLPT